MTSPTSREEQRQITQDFDSLRTQWSLLPIKVSPFFQKKVEEEVSVLGHTEGPLHRMVYPSRDRLFLHRQNDEVPDFVEDRSHMPPETSGEILHKYSDRILFMPTSTCASHCQYCFRQDLLSQGCLPSVEKKLEHSVQNLLSYLNAHPEIWEVILSGGDPLTLPRKDLLFILSSLKTCPQIRSVRLHTKTISFSPQVFKDSEKLALLAAFHVRLVFHLTHPYELCPIVEETITRLKKEGIACYNQFPLLRKINDHPDVLRLHLETLDRLGVRNLSIFLPEPVYFSGAFRLSLDRFWTLAEKIFWTTPAWINATRFLLDTPIGKVRREDLLSYDPLSRKAIFRRNGATVSYYDFPSHLDHPGEREILLWKERKERL